MTEPLADDVHQLPAQSLQGEKDLKPHVAPLPKPTSSELASSTNKDLPPEGHPADSRHYAELMEKLQRALHHIKLLETHNTKLFEDNCQLVAAVNMLNERHVFVGAASDTQVRHLASLQEKLHASETHRATVVRKYQDLLANNSSATVYHHLATELHATRAAHVQLDKEYQLMKEKYSRMKSALSTDNKAAQQAPPVLVPGHPVVVSQPGGNPYPVVSQAQRHERRLSADTQAHIARHQHPHSRSSPVSPSTSFGPDNLATTLQQRAVHKRWTSEGIAQLHAHRSPTAITWLPTPPPSATYKGPGSPTATFPPRTAPPVLTGPSHAPPQHPGPPHVPTLRHVSVPVGKSQIQHSAAQAFPAPASQLVGFDLGQREVVDLTQDHPTPQTVSGESTNVSISQPPYSLKRPSADLQDSANAEEGEHKKLRIEGLAAESVRTPPTASGFGQTGASLPSQKFSDEALIKDSAQSVPSSTILSPPAATADPHSQSRPAAAGEEGLRAYEECVNLIFEKDADIENGLFCGPCLDRYEAGMLQEPPDILAQPNFDQLVMHCMTLHPTIWDDLRHRRDAV
ncbi:hypothetical protein F5I97DRAFT_847903 [Phlebopus sp. FC_14]|nr:hypothetical protein F5I97DRAFT_847903 [Phlebopus sp. FC_14]